MIKNVIKMASFLAVISPSTSYSQSWNSTFSTYGSESSAQLARDVDINANGNTIVVGEMNNSLGSSWNGGAIRIYETNNQTFTQKGNTLFGSSSYAFFGSAVAINSNGNVVAGSQRNYDILGTPNLGSVKVYEWTGTSWNQKGSSILGESSFNYSGKAIDLNASGNIIAISSIDNDDAATDAGHVRIFEYTSSGWTQMGSDIDGTGSTDEFGTSLGLSSDGLTIAAGAPQNNDGGSNSGHVRIFTWNGTSWVQKGATIAGTSSGDRIGESVEMSSDGNTVAIGCTTAGNGGQIRVYTWDGVTWNQKGSNISSENSGDYLGFSVSISKDGETVAAGAPQNDGGGNNSGHARIYKYISNAWVQSGSDFDGDPLDRLGESIALDSLGNRMIVGSPVYGSTNIGKAEVFTLCSNTSYTDVQIGCEEFTWINGQTYTTSNNTSVYYMFNSAGCDSIVQLDLTIVQPTTHIDTQLACSPYEWIDGNVYSETNSSAGVDTLVSYQGCDSIVILNLEILDNTGVDEQWACDSLVWVDGLTYTSANSTAQYTYSNIHGCDSVVTLDFQLYPQTGIDEQIACESLVWIDGNTYSSDNNTAQHTLTSVHGCDSIVTLNLSIVEINDEINVTGDHNEILQAQQSGSTYQWIDCSTNTPISGATQQNYTSTQNGEFAVIVSNQGCSDTSSCVAVETLNIDDLNQEPLQITQDVQGNVSIVNNSTVEKVFVSVYSVTGKRIEVKTINAFTSFTLHTANWSSGIYILNFESKEYRLQHKVLKY